MAKAMSLSTIAEPRAKRSRAASDKFGRSGSSRFCEMIEPPEASTQSAPNKTTEIAAPADIAKKKVERNFSAMLGTICLVLSGPGSTAGPTRSMYTGTNPTHR